jgi:hypothetical protein
MELCVGEDPVVRLATARVGILIAALILRMRTRGLENLTQSGDARLGAVRGVKIPS